MEAATPGLFAADSSGTGQALAVDADGTLNSSDNPAQADSVIVLYATGGGQTSPAAQDGATANPGQPLQPLLPVSVAIGGQPAQVLYAGSAAGMVEGVLQIDLVVPPDAPTGPALPVVLKVGDRYSQDGLTVAIH